MHAQTTLPLLGLLSEPKMSYDDPLNPSSIINIQPGGVQHDQGEVYQKLITFSKVSQSGQVEIKIGSYIPIP